MTPAPPITFEEIEPTIRRLAATRRTDLNFLEEVLGMKFEKDLERPHWTHWCVKSPREPYIWVGFSQGSDAALSRLGLTLHEDLAPAAGDAIQKKYGSGRDFYAIPTMGREGADEESYALDLATVTFTLSSRSRRLIGWAIEWPF